MILLAAVRGLNSSDTDGAGFLIKPSKKILSSFRPNFCQKWGQNFLEALIKNPLVSENFSPLTAAKRIMKNVDCSRIEPVIRRLVTDTLAPSHAAEQFMPAEQFWAETSITRA